MRQYSQFIIAGIIVLAVIIIASIVAHHIRKRRKAEEKRQKEEEQRRVSAYYAKKQKKRTPLQPDLDQEITLKRPGPKDKLPWDNSDIIAGCMKHAKIYYTHAKIVHSTYVVYKNQSRSKRAKGHWQFTIRYAA